LQQSIEHTNGVSREAAVAIQAPRAAGRIDVAVVRYAAVRAVVRAVAVAGRRAKKQTGIVWVRT